MRLLVCVLIVCGAPGGPPNVPAAPRVEYTLRHEPGNETEPTWWTVEVAVAGAPVGAGVELALSDWGGWRDVPAYVELVEADPAPSHDSEPGRWTFAAGRRGRVEARYRVRLTRLGDEEQRRHGLLPTQAPEYAFGYSWNTLARVHVDGRPVAELPRIRIEAPRGTPIVTGWAGRSKGVQRAVLGAAMGNGPIAFGTPAVELVQERRGFPVEVRQFGDGPDVTETVADVLAACAPAFEEAFGAPARRPYRAFVTDTQGGGMGSHFGLRIGVTADAPADHARSPWLRSHVAHELMHDWLGLALTEESSALVWFQEGFTEYLALWQAAAAELVGRDWFAGRLLELEGIARGSPAAGQVAFGDPSVTWRDGDGANETLVYTAAPLLALRVDAELRAADHAGLPQLVRDLLARPSRTFGLADLRAWFEQKGLAARWEASVGGAELPDVAESLALAGYGVERVPADLTYLGLRTDGDEPGCTVLAVDPGGPAARAGVRAGDVLTGWFPARSERAHPDEPCDFPFGLGTFEPGAEGTYVGTRRAGVDHQVPLDPELLPGAGHHRRRDCDTPALDAFFRFEPE